MGHRLRVQSVEDGVTLSEKACENYQCKSCGKKMISVNFVNGICIQVFVSHGEDCKLFHGNAFQKTTAVTCDTCKYYDAEQGCVCDKTNHRINSVRTAV